MVKVIKLTVAGIGVIVSEYSTFGQLLFAVTSITSAVPVTRF